VIASKVHLYPSLTDLLDILLKGSPSGLFSLKKLEMIAFTLFSQLCGDFCLIALYKINGKCEVTENV